MGNQSNSIFLPCNNALEKASVILKKNSSCTPLYHSISHYTSVKIETICEAAARLYHEK